MAEPHYELKSSAPQLGAADTSTEGAAGLSRDLFSFLWPSEHGTSNRFSSESMPKVSHQQSKSGVKMLLELIQITAGPTLFGMLIR